jgi:hypothetical protein
MANKQKKHISALHYWVRTERAKNMCWEELCRAMGWALGYLFCLVLGFLFSASANKKQFPVLLYKTIH